MSTTPSAERQDADHYEHLRRVEREGAIAQLVAAAQAAARMGNRQNQLGVAAPEDVSLAVEMAQAALEAYRRTETKP